MAKIPKEVIMFNQISYAQEQINEAFIDKLSDLRNGQAATALGVLNSFGDEVSQLVITTITYFQLIIEHEISLDFLINRVHGLTKEERRQVKEFIILQGPRIR
jgi:hypothetical protein